MSFLNINSTPPLSVFNIPEAFVDGRSPHDHTPFYHPHAIDIASFCWRWDPSNISEAFVDGSSSYVYQKLL
ncbi:1774_t:CDS:2 [Funneliformis caledonium]|uniref:1774_t:CDS:1 n=1 Tax=Funneliformis caledonium TaxID=1117310 RepID=A0A9N9FKJ7_9GLOM|nr:1774_t:CDS:2 [Funneliformis caledonium]